MDAIERKQIEREIDRELEPYKDKKDSGWLKWLRSIKIDNLIAKREHWIDKDDKVVKTMERLTEKKDKEALNRWTKAWLKEDAREMRNWERDFIKD